MGIIWTIIIGFIAGVIAKFVMPGDNEPKGFILTTILGVVGAFVATYLGQAVGWYHAGDGAGFIGHRRRGDPSLPLQPYHGPAQRLAAQVWTGCHTG